MEAILGTIVGFVAFGLIWFFLLKPKNNQISTEELRNKEEELKRSQIDLATREAEIKAAVEAKQNLTNQLEEKKGEAIETVGGGSLKTRKQRRSRQQRIKRSKNGRQQRRSRQQSRSRQQPRSRKQQRGSGKLRTKKQRK